jgi:hypothetical protein
MKKRNHIVNALHLKGISLKVLLTAAALVLISCSSAVVRWPNGLTDEAADKTLPCTLEKDIFADFLWTAPPVGSQKIAFKNNTAKINFAGDDLVVQLEQNGKVSLTQKGNKMTVDSEKTKNDRYYSIEKLGLKTVTRSRMVPKSRFETQRVPVQKSRQVSTTRSVYNSSTKSYSMQTQMQTQYYTDYENRQVLKTYYEWQTVSEKVHDIPVYTVFKFDLSGGERIYVYATEAGYYFQNASYYSYLEKKKGFISDITVRVMLTDVNADGKYTSDQDRVLFNTWNPYVKNSTYVEMPGITDNIWFDVKWLREDRFIGFSIDRNAKTVFVSNANAKYINVSSKGKISVTGLNSNDMAIYLNGGFYKIPSSGLFENNIEYGIYTIRIRRKGYLDFAQTFEVNDQNPAVKIAYQDTPKAGTFVLVHAFKQWKLSASDGKTTPVTVYNLNELSLLPGKYAVTIVGDGVNIQKEVAVEQGQTLKYNFMTDSLAKE